MVSMLQEAWTHYIGVISGGPGRTTADGEIDFDEVYGEESIVLNLIVRILNHIIVQVKLSDLSELSAQVMLTTAMTIS